MKKLRCLAWLLVAVTLFSIMPIATTSAEAAAETVPIVLKDGTAIFVKQLVDFTTVTGSMPTGWNTVAEATNAGYEIVANGSFLTPTENYGNASRFKDALGVLIEYDATNATADSLVAPIVRLWDSSMTTNEQYWTTADKASEYYVYTESLGWSDESVETATAYGSWASVSKGSRGYVYVPIKELCKNNTIGGDESTSCIVNDVANAKEADYVLGEVGANHYSSTGFLYKSFSIVYEAKTEITGASLTLTNNFNVNFLASVPESATSVRMKVSRDGVTESLAGILQSDGTYRFEYKDILPQCMSETITATLYATVEGFTKTDSVEYSIRDYCMNKLVDTTSSVKLKTLLVDILHYGAAAQTYQGYRTDDLATKQLTDTQRALRSKDSLSEITAEAVLSGTPNDSYKWVGASLRLESSLAMKLRFKAVSVEGVTVQINVAEKTMELNNFAAQGDGTYTILLDGLLATQYASPVTAVIKKNGEQIGQSLQYSVDANLKKTAEQNACREICRSICAYGTAATAYVMSIETVWKTVPKFVSETAVSEGDYSCGEGNTEMSYQNVTAEEYRDYIATLTTAGFTAYDTNNIGNNLFGTYLNGDVQVNTCWYPSKNLLHIIYGDKGYLAAVEPEAITSVCEPTITQMGLSGMDLDGAPGMSYVIQLSDGRYILIDGGEKNDTDKAALLKFLQDNAPAGVEKPVIAAWFITHAHGDHLRLPYEFLLSYHNEIELQTVAYNIPDFSSVKVAGGSLTDDTDGEIDYMNWLTNNFKNTVSSYYPNANTLIFHTGQNICIGDARIEIIHTHEDLRTTTFASGNHTSAAFRITLGSKMITMLGDSEAPLCQFMAEVYGDALKSDILQVSHHGFNGGNLALYQGIDPDICFWPVDENRFNSDYRCVGTQSGTYKFNYWLRNDSIKEREHYHASVTTTISLE